MKEITPEQIRAYRHARESVFDSELEPSWILCLADGWRDTLAALMQSEFEREHRLFINSNYFWCFRDPRHNYTWEQWQAAADKLLSGEGG